MRSTLLRMSSGQKILLIEPKIRRKIVAAERDARASHRPNGSSAGGNSACTSVAFSSSEKVPFQKTCARLGRHQAAFQKSLQLVFEADLVVRNGPRAATAAQQAQRNPREPARSELANTLAR